LFERGFEIFHDFGGDDVWRGEIRGILEGFVFEPENVEVDLVAFDEVVVGEAFEAFALGALVAVLGVVAGDEIFTRFAGRTKLCTWVLEAFIPRESIFRT
jgi:hypothetical protein